MKKSWTFLYWFPESEWFEWETEITDEEAAIIDKAIANNEDLDSLDSLVPLYNRVWAEIEESYASEECDEDDDFFDDEEENLCEGMTIRITDPNDPFYSIQK